MIYKKVFAISALLSFSSFVLSAYAEDKPISIIAGEHVINKNNSETNSTDKSLSSPIIKVEIPKNYNYNSSSNVIVDKSKFSIDTIDKLDDNGLLFKHIDDSQASLNTKNNLDEDNGLKPITTTPRKNVSESGVPISHFYVNGKAKDILDDVQDVDDDDIIYLDQPTFQKNIDDCVGYVTSIRFVANKVTYKQQDYCLEFGSHIPVVIKQYYKRTGLEDYKYSWNLNIIPTNNGFSEKDKITLLGYYNVPVNVTTGDQNNIDAFLSLPIVQNIIPVNEPNKWFNIQAVNIHSSYGYIPLSLQMSFRISNNSFSK